MKSALQAYSAWTRRRFLSFAGALFVLQAGLLFLFGDRSQPQPPKPGRLAARFSALGAAVDEEQLLRQFFTGDPAVFLVPNPHGFSGPGWLNQRPLRYQAEYQLEAPAWLNLDTAGLGTHFSVFPSGSEPPPLDLAGQPARREEPPPAFLPPEVVPAQSVFRLEGGLGGRLLGAAPPLDAWASAKLLANSVVQIAVDPAGEVVAARLEARCGSAEADAAAVAAARALRFRPSRPAGTRWGEAVFQWQTIEPAGSGPLK
jgi:TonB family protein